MTSAFEDCCGLGCNNCILDRFLESGRPRNNCEKFNLFNRNQNYQKFKVKNINKVYNFVFQFTFELVCDREEPFHDDEQLLAPSISYLMLRTNRNYDEQLPNFNPLFAEYEEFLSPPIDVNKGKYYRSEPQRFDKGTPEVYFSRKYTPFEINEELRTFKILVKLEKYGKMSRYLAKLEEGSICEWKGPYEAFPYVHEAIENYIVFTQGISIVSSFRLVKEIIYESAQSRILVISCFKDLDECFLRDDFYKLTHYWCLKHHIYLSSADSSIVKTPPRSGENIHDERLNAENFKKLMSELKFYDPKRTQVLLSGREDFIEFCKSLAMENKFIKFDEI